jgi:diguanylate cyclase (GGDEF)-like protein
MATLAPAAATAGIDPTRLAAACREAGRILGRADHPAGAVESALAAVHAADLLVSLFVLEHGRLWIVAQRGYPIILDGLPAGVGVMGRAIRLRRAQLVLDVTADDDFIEAAQGVVSELAVPLQLDGRVIGVFNVESTAPLPRDAARIVRPLVRRLVPLVHELRSTRRLDLSALARLFVYLSSLRDPVAIAEIAAASLARVVAVETSQVILFAEDGSSEELACWRAAGAGLEPFRPDEVARARGASIPGAVAELLPVPADRAGGEPRVAVWLPLRASAVELGVLVGSSRNDAHELDQHQAEVAALLAAHVAASLDGALLLDRERANALTDPLTGLLTRRGFETRLEAELDAAQGERRPLSVLVLDCDDFKAVNDRAGHEFGDALLREVGSALSALLPPSAASARLGGDEFVVLLPDTDADTAKALGNRLRARLTERLADAGFPMHVSAGFSTYPFDGGGVSQLLRGADQALYAAKALGKDRVIGIRDALYGTDEGRSRVPVARRERRAGRSDGALLGDLADAADALWQEATHSAVLERLCKALTFVVGATGCLASRVEGDYLYDAARHALRDVDLGVDSAYLISDFPLTERALCTGESRSVSFLDPDIDRAEAFVLRGLSMNCVLLLPLHVGGTPWALVELYDVRLRHFTDAERATAEFLVRQAARRIETITATSQARSHSHPLPIVRVPGRETDEQG